MASVRPISVHEVMTGHTGVQSHAEQLVGVEIEIEQVTRAPDDDEFMTIWSIVGDGSLRNNGMEFVSRPLPASRVPNALKMVYKAWVKYNYSTHMRCGIHLHMNCNDRFVADLAGIFTTYSLVEPALYAFCGPMREENIYCIPWYRASNEATILADALRGAKQGKSAGYVRENLRVLCKYSGLFAGPLVKFGTIEFRHAPTWDNVEQTQSWYELVSRVFDYGRNRTAAEVLDSWHNNSRLMLRQIFGTAFPQYSNDDMISKIEDVGCVSVAEKFLLNLPPVSWKPSSLRVDGEGTRGLAEADVDVTEVRIGVASAPVPPPTPRIGRIPTVSEYFAPVITTTNYDTEYTVATQIRR